MKRTAVTANTDALHCYACPPTSDQGLLDAASSRKVEQEVLDLSDEPTRRWSLDTKG